LLVVDRQSLALGQVRRARFEGRLGRSQRVGVPHAKRRYDPQAGTNDHQAVEKSPPRQSDFFRRVVHALCVFSFFWITAHHSPPIGVEVRTLRAPPMKVKI
jgi:hypothetical protein